MNFLTLLVPLVEHGPDKVPAPEDVKAGWVAFAVFIGLGIAVVLLGVSLTRHLRKARANADLGRFDSSDAADTNDANGAANGTGGTRPPV